MNAGTLSAILIGTLFAVEASAFAEASGGAKSEPTEAQLSIARDTQAPLSIGSPDFRRPSIADTFEPSSGGIFKALGVGMFVTAGADLASTELSLTRPGVYEMNPLQRNRSVRLLSHVAAPAFTYWVTEKLHKEGHTRAALFARIGFNVAYSYVVMHNLRTAQMF